MSVDKYWKSAEPQKKWSEEGKEEDNIDVVISVKGWDITDFPIGKVLEGALGHDGVDQVP